MTNSILVSEFRWKNSNSNLTWASECHSFAAHCFDFGYFSGFLDILHANRSFQLEEMISKYIFCELWYTEWIEAPINWMPSLKCAINWNQYCVRFVCLTKKRKRNKLTTFGMPTWTSSCRISPSTKCERLVFMRKCWKTFVPVFMFIKNVTSAFCLSSYFDGSTSSFVAFFHSSFCGSL